MKKKAFKYKISTKKKIFRICYFQKDNVLFSCNYIHAKCPVPDIFPVLTSCAAALNYMFLITLIFL